MVVKTYGRKPKFIVFFALCFTLLLVSSSRAHAEPGDIHELDPPEGYKSGDRCPPPETYEEILPHYMSFCGQIRSVAFDKSLTKQEPGKGIGGVMLVTYKDRRGGALTNWHSATVTNDDGEFFLPIPKFGSIYLAIMCKTGDGFVVVDSYQVSAATMGETFKNFNLGTICSSQSYELKQDLIPEKAEFTVAAGLECGEVPKKPMYTWGEGRVDTSENITVTDKEDTFVRNGQFAGDNLNVVQTGKVPEFEQNVSKQSIEGRLKNLLSEDKNQYHATNLIFTGGNYDYIRNLGTESSLPLCDSEKITDANKIVSESDYNIRAFGGIISLMPPGYLEKLERTVSKQTRAAKEVCMDKDGSVKTLADFDINKPGYPIKSLLEVVGDYNHKYVLPLSQMDRSANDSGENKASETGANTSGTVGGTTAIQSNTGGTGICRDTLFDLTGKLSSAENVANKPFESCFQTRVPAKTYNQALLTNNILEENPMDILKIPGSNMDEDAALPEKLKRLGTPQPYCTLSTIDSSFNSAALTFWGEEEEPTTTGDTTSKGTSVTSQQTSYGENDPIAAGYKVLSDQAADLGTFYKKGLINAIANGFVNLISKFAFAFENSTHWLKSLENNDTNGCVQSVGYKVVSPQECEGTGAKFCKVKTTCTEDVVPCKTWYEKEYFEYICTGSMEYGLDVTANIRDPEDSVPLAGNANTPINYLRKLFSTPADEAFLTSVGTNMMVLAEATKGTSSPLTILKEKTSAAGNIPVTDGVRFNLEVFKDHNLDITKAIAKEVEVLGVCGGERFSEVFKDINLPEPTAQAKSYFEAFADIPEESAQAYGYAEEKTGIPCEIIAGIHFLEGGNDPTQRVEDGLPLKPGETIQKSAENVAKVLKNYMTGDFSTGACEGMDKTNAFTKYTGALSCRQNSGNSQCTAPAGTTNYPKLPGRCPRLFLGEDDPYPMNWIDQKHTNMSLIGPMDGVNAKAFCDMCKSGNSRVSNFKTLCSQCPPPLPFDRPGVWAFAILYHRYMTGE